MDAQSGVEPQTETVWRQATNYRVPRIVYVNKMDKAGANFEASIESVRTKLNGNAVAIQLNIGAEADFVGLIDLVEFKAFSYDGQKEENEIEIEIPAELKEKAQQMRLQLAEAVADFDENLLNDLLEEKEISPEQLRTAIRKATITGDFFPVVCGTSFKNKGVKKMIDAVIDYLPSPLDVPAIKAFRDEQEITIEASDGQEFSALAFKIMNDPFVGSLTFFRVYSGVLSKGSYIINSTKGKKERVGRILAMHANSREEIDEVRTGDIGAFVGLKDTTTGDSLISEKAKSFVLEKMSFPEPVISQSLEPFSKAEVEKLANALQKLANEDPTFKT